MPSFSIIVAMDQNRVIGKQNQLPWKLPKELQYVKEKTMGHTIVLGRKNYESIGRPLPGRRNIILTRDASFEALGCEVAHSIEEVFTLCEQDQEVFIFGGEQIYRCFLPFVDKMYMTRIHFAFDGDTFFPAVDLNKWEERIPARKGITDEENPYVYYYHVYERKREFVL